jgi:hypothetical protein
VRFVTQPLVARLDQSALLTVWGLRRWKRLEVRLVGSTTAIGLIEPWQPLRFHNGTWTVHLYPLELRGVYPIQLREQPGGRILQSNHWLLRVLARGTLACPTFANPIDVARAWVNDVAHGKLVAVKPWPFRTSDHRDRRLHLKLVVAYNPADDPSLSGRLGIFITCVRVNFRSNWRLLEATIAP